MSLISHTVTTELCSLGSYPECKLNICGHVGPTRVILNELSSQLMSTFSASSTALTPDSLTLVSLGRSPFVQIFEAMRASVLSCVCVCHKDFK